ncbi:dorsalin-1-like [Bufo gargarizans]|uniref:dorsalin-1-like n=1 Tax=Bufo gargarizans TaxID=30331 RepID=UPI001CF46A14|nr:dorsalin-1-like [Bufo gargarizans]
MMWLARLPMLCSLVIFQARFTLNKPLPKWENDLLTHYEEEAEEVLSSLTGTMKEELKESLNLTGAVFQEKTTMKLPQYMIDLYNQYADDRTSMPVSNIIRSFNVEDILSSCSQENLLQSAILLFNVTIPQHEEVMKAELKLKLSLGHSNLGHLSLFDVIHLEPSENLMDSNSFLSSKDIKGDDSLTIDVTKAVKRWIKSKVQLNKLEMFLKMKAPLDMCFKTEESAVYSDSSHPPILIIFSDDQSENNVKENPMDLTQMMFYQQSNNIEIYSKNTTDDHGEGHEPLEEGKPRAKRSAERSHCTKASLIVNFKDIGWDSFILFPPSYDAGQCVGDCYLPLTDNLTPTKHAIVQSVMHKNKPNDVRNVCCVPTKLDSIPVLYLEKQTASITAKQQPALRKYYDMKVVECGCR